MSSDGEYLLTYECQNYCKPTPMEKDKTYLEEKFGGELIVITEFLLYYEKPKYRLYDEDLQKLCADQVFECVNGSHWEIVK